MEAKVGLNPPNYTLPGWVLYSIAEDHIRGIPAGLLLWQLQCRTLTVCCACVHPEETGLNVPTLSEKLVLDLLKLNQISGNALNHTAKARTNTNIRCL